MSTVQNKIKNLHELGAADVGIATDVEANATMHNRASMMVNTSTTLNNMNLASIQAIGSTEFLYTGLTGGQTVATTGVQLANDNGDGVTLALDWAYVGASDYEINFIVLDNSATGDNLAYVNLTGVNTATSPRLDATNWKLVTDQYGYKLVFKSRSLATNHVVFDSVRGVTKFIMTNSTAVEGTNASSLTNVNPFSVTIGTAGDLNTNLATYVLTVEQTIRRTAGYRTDAGVIQNSKNNTGTDLLEKDTAGQPQIRHYNPITGFEVVIHTGNGVAGRSIKTGSKYDLSHTKALTGALVNWRSYDSYNGATKTMYLDLTNLSTLSPTTYNNTEPTNNTFTFGTDISCNASGVQYITYGQTNSANHYIGAYQGTGQIGNEIDLGLDMTADGAYCMIKRTDASYSWFIYDNVRGAGATSNYLLADTSGVEVANTTDLIVEMTKTGIIVGGANANLNALGGSYLINAYSPVYAKPTGSKEIGFNSNVSVIGANGKTGSANNTVANTFATLGSLSLAGLAGTHQYVTLDTITGAKTLTPYKHNIGVDRASADKWGEDVTTVTVDPTTGVTTTAVTGKTTARHGTYESATGVVSASSNYTIYYPYFAFDKATDATNTSWITGVALPSWINYALSKPKNLLSFRVRTANDTDTTRYPKDYTLSGLNSDGTWTVLHTTIGETITTVNTWTADKIPSDTTTKFLDYKVDITANNGHVTYTALGDIEFNFAISDAPYLNTRTNEVLDSTDTKCNLLQIAELDVDSQDMPYNLKEFDSNVVDFNGARFHGVVDLSANTYLITNKNSILPDFVTVNKRYILDNPFGEDVPVEVEFELMINNVWSKVEWMLSGSSHGVSVAYVQGLGIVLQTGTILSSTSINTGGGHGYTGGNLSSAPCRVWVTRKSKGGAL